MIRAVHQSFSFLHKLAYAVLICHLCVSLSARDALGAETGNEETMLMFIGEDLEVLSIASRRKESAWQAPAVARVITREELRERGARTVSEALQAMPGFYMAGKEWGAQPYLRGIPNSVLFLYDTVPMSSDISKLTHPMDYDLSLTNVKRIEIISGPGSVLWGPDAFAGIVNVVPMSGKDFSGVESGAVYGEPGHQKGAYLNIGHDADQWDAFFSVSGRKGEDDDARCNLVRFWKDDASPHAPRDRFGEKYPAASRYVEAAARFSYGNWLSVTGRISDNKRFYAMSDAEQDVYWPESRRLPLGFVKLEARKDLSHNAALRLTGFYSSLQPEYQVIDRVLKQQENTAYGELIYDKSFFTGQGLFTGGASFREKIIENAPIWDGYLTEYLGPDNENLVPIISEKDYGARLRSLFGQYRHRFEKTDFWAGARFDEHDQYQDHISVSAGAAWSPTSEWRIKLLGGTAYRTPFSRQLLEEEKPDLENIMSVSAQVAWKPDRRIQAAVCGFFSQIDNHFVEDPYYGLSEPNAQDIMGAEIEIQLAPHDSLELSSSLTLIRNSGPDETYYYNDYAFYRPDGSVERHYAELSYPYDIGADALFNVSGLWKPRKDVTVNVTLRYASSARLIYPLTSEVVYGSSGWTADLAAVFSKITAHDFTLRVSLKNITNRDYQVPGTYSLINADPFYGEILLQKSW